MGGITAEGAPVGGFGRDYALSSLANRGSRLVVVLAGLVVLLASLPTTGAGAAGTSAQNSHVRQRVRREALPARSRRKARDSSSGIVFVGTPGTGAPPSQLGPYGMTRFGKDPQQVGATVTSATSTGTGRVLFSSPVTHDLVGDGWQTWSNDYTGDVYDSGTADTLTLKLPGGATAFYFYAEPDDFDEFTMTATAQDGTTSGPIAVQGEAGANYFGFYTSKKKSPLVSISISSADEFAVGEFGIAGSNVVTTACQQQYVFVHGIHGNYTDYQAAIGKRNGADFASLLHTLQQQCPDRQNVHIAPYFEDLGFSKGGPGNSCSGSNPQPDTNTESLYVDPDALSENVCDGNGALAFDSTELDDYLTHLEAAYPGDPFTILANSMGGAVARGWIALAQERGDATLTPVSNVIFLQGAQEGSIWAGIAETDGVGTAIYKAATKSPLGSWVSTLNFNPSRPGIADLAPQSDWYQSVNPIGVPDSVGFYNFASDIEITLQINALVYTQTVASVGLGDLVMLPGSSNPSDEPAGGGEDFLPTGAGNAHQFLLEDKANEKYDVSINPVNGAVALGLVTLGGPLVGGILAIANFFPKTALKDPTNHIELPSDTGNGKTWVQSCTGVRTTPVQEIVAIVTTDGAGCSSSGSGSGSGPTGGQPSAAS
jgi:hypothetical protein